MHLGPWEIAAIVVVVLIVFGAGKLPEAFRSMGKGIREFNKGKSGEYDEDKKPQIEASKPEQINPEVSAASVEQVEQKKEA
jgi:sec-independent protein translocase protein TatA